MDGKHVDHVTTLMATVTVERIRSCWISEGWDSSAKKSDLRN